MIYVTPIGEDFPGTLLSDTIFGLEGDNTLRGLGGNNLLEGNDLLFT